MPIASSLQSGMANRDLWHLFLFFLSFFATHNHVRAELECQVSFVATSIHSNTFTISLVCYRWCLSVHCVCPRTHAHSLGVSEQDRNNLRKSRHLVGYYSFKRATIASHRLFSSFYLRVLSCVTIFKLAPYFFNDCTYGCSVEPYFSFSLIVLFVSYISFIELTATQYSSNYQFYNWYGIILFLSVSFSFNTVQSPRIGTLWPIS